jgi:hypothetical protein
VKKIINDNIINISSHSSLSRCFVPEDHYFKITSVINNVCKLISESELDISIIFDYAYRIKIEGKSKMKNTFNIDLTVFGNNVNLNVSGINFDSYEFNKFINIIYNIYQNYKFQYTRN